MPEGTRSEGRGLLGTLGDLTATLVAAAHTRLDLLSLDLEEDRDNLVILTLTALGAAFCFGVGVVLAVLVVVTLFWETHRILVLVLLAGIFLSLGLAAARRVKRLSKARPRLFASSLAELFKDRQRLASRS